MVVTGIGMVTPLGATAASTAGAWRDGRNAVRARLPELAGTSLECVEAAVLPEIDAAERLGGRRMLKYMSPAAMLGCVAAHEAAADAHLRERFPPERIGLFAGTGLASAGISDVMPVVRESIDEAGRFSCQLLGRRGLAAANPLISFKILANMPPCLVSIIESIKGPNLIFTPWEGQAGAALAEAWRAVAEGEVDCALAGSADCPSQPATVVYLKQARLLRDGEPAAAGAAYVVLERAETAAAHGRRAYARIASMEVVNDGGPVCDPLAGRMGRTFAAAPAILLGLACLQSASREVSIRGVDGHVFRAALEGWP